MGADDTKLVRRARGGSDTAFAMLVDRHQQGLRQFLRRTLGNEADADEMAQEAFLAAWSNLRRLRDTGGFRPWLYGIAWRKAKGHQRRAVRARAREDAFAETQDQTHTPEREAALTLQNALGQLSENEAAALSLCLGAGLSHREAATALEMPLGTLKSHITRGRARLAKLMGVETDD